MIAAHGKTPLGMIFMEISQGPILVDNNLVVSSGHSSIYEHDTARMVTACGPPCIYAALWWRPET